MPQVRLDGPNVVDYSDEEVGQASSMLQQQGLSPEDAQTYAPAVIRGVEDDAYRAQVEQQQSAPWPVVAKAIQQFDASQGGQPQQSGPQPVAAAQATPPMTPANPLMAMLGTQTRAPMRQRFPMAPTAPSFQPPVNPLLRMLGGGG